MKLSSDVFDAEFWGAFTGVSGALLLALTNDSSRYGWLLFLASNIAWIVFAIHGKFSKMLVQQFAFASTSMIGIWNTFLAATPVGIWAKQGITSILAQSQLVSLLQFLLQGP